MQTIYQKRWKVEVYHKSLKRNASFAKSPTKTIRSQSNHFFACLWAYVKLEKPRLQTKMNHCAMKAKIYQKALASAFEQLLALKESGAPALGELSLYKSEHIESLIRSVFMISEASGLRGTWRRVYITLSLTPTCGMVAHIYCLSRCIP